MKKHHLLFFFVLFISSCSLNFIPVSLDIFLGEQSKNELNANPLAFKILDESEYPNAYQKINEIKDKILNSNKIQNKANFTWEIKIIEDDSTLNAFCLPGGYIYVYTGLIKYLESEDALAGVIGHEMAHADLRHASNQMVKDLGFSFLLQFILGIDQGSLLNVGAKLISLSFNRSDESEADMKSVEYLYDSDLDARGAALFFEKLIKDGKNPNVLEYISTHPDPDKRIEKIYETWRALGGKKGKKNIKSYQDFISELP